MSNSSEPADVPISWANVKMLFSDGFSSESSTPTANTKNLSTACDMKVLPIILRQPYFKLRYDYGLETAGTLLLIAIIVALLPTRQSTHSFEPPNPIKWPAYESLVNFADSTESLYEFSLESIHWFLLRNVCYDPQSASFTLFSNIDADHLSRLQSLLPIPITHSPNHLSEFARRAGENVETGNVWGWFVSPDLEGIAQQRILLHSIFAHPDFFPPVGHPRGFRVDRRLLPRLAELPKCHKKAEKTAGRGEFDGIPPSLSGFYDSKRRQRVEFQSNSIHSLPSRFHDLFLLFGSTFPLFITTSPFFLPFLPFPLFPRFPSFPVLVPRGYSRGLTRFRCAPISTNISRSLRKMPKGEMAAGFPSSTSRAF